MTKLLGSLTVTGLAAVALVCTMGGRRASASSGQSGQLHIVKDCSAYTRLAGGFCTIVTSNLAEIPKGSVVHYTQAFGILNPGWLDSNVVLDAGNGNKAAGRCTVDFTIATPGVCTFQDGTGQLAGFTARVAVGTTPTPPAEFTWDGTYSFQNPGQNQN
ncbi:MAG TPA: hypothetical protein VKB88_31410 [Bryobacteraceae bacterium]|nr:hypothetical protein [Bryobacteraceae bacterium]